MLTDNIRVEAMPAFRPASMESKKMEEPKQSFADFLNQAIEKVNQGQLEADQLTQKLVTGEIDELHQVLIAAEKANIQLQLTLQIRNKVVEAYQEMMRMQM
jgi:flagellar hook-basal body complex protein FliE